MNTKVIQGKAVDNAAARIRFVKESIFKSTGIDEGDQKQMLFDSGIAYAYFLSDNNESMVKAFTRSKAFWKFFKVLWMNADERFMAKVPTAKYITPDNKQALYTLYLQEHRVMDMITPLGAHSYDCGYQAMVEEMMAESILKGY